MSREDVGRVTTREVQELREAFIESAQSKGQVVHEGSGGALVASDVVVFASLQPPDSAEWKTCGVCGYRNHPEDSECKGSSHDDVVSGRRQYIPDLREIWIDKEGFHRVAKDTNSSSLPTDSAERKDIPLARGVLDYFPAALVEVARLSQHGNDKHNPGEELNHARGKSTDHADCIMRHLVERGTVDPEDGISHSVKVAWRALALLQEELEAAGAPLARGARLPEEESPDTTG